VPNSHECTGSTLYWQDVTRATTGNDNAPEIAATLNVGGLQRLQGPALDAISTIVRVQSAGNKDRHATNKDDPQILSEYDASRATQGIRMSNRTTSQPDRVRVLQQTRRRRGQIFKLNARDFRLG